MNRFVLTVALCCFSLPVLAQTAPPHAPGMKPMPHMTAPPPGKFPAKPMSGAIVGNKKTHVYHLPGDPSLPSPKNRVTFKTVAEATKAGYHAPGAGPKVPPKKMPSAPSKPAPPHP